MRLSDLLGLPAITLPTGHPACGISLLGHAGQDRHLLRVAAGAEAADGRMRASAMRGATAYLMRPSGWNLTVPMGDTGARA
mgnify:CR=1 FL=1